MKRGQVGEESVWWANTRHMFKAYLKGAEMVKHGKAERDRSVLWCKDNGVVRVEVELKRRLLQALEMREFAAVSDEKIAAVFAEQTSILRRVDRSDEPDILAALPARSRVYASAWLAGQDLRACMAERSLYRHAKVLREYGIDILRPRNVCGFPVKVRVVDLVPATAPDWYSLKVA
jgi:hypothetical protein